MKRFLTGLMLLIGIVSGAQSGTSDTLCFDTPTIRKLLIAGEQGKVLKEQVMILDQRITGLQEIISQQREKDTATVRSYEMQLTAMREQRKELERIIKIERRKRFWTGAIGMATTVGMGYLLISK